MEPGAGIEPATYGLRNRCSTAELPRRRCGAECPLITNHSPLPGRPMRAGASVSWASFVIRAPRASGPGPRTDGNPGGGGGRAISALDSLAGSTYFVIVPVGSHARSFFFLVSAP